MQMMPTYETLHKQTAEIIHNGNSCTSWEAAQEMAEEILQGLVGSLPIGELTYPSQTHTAHLYKPYEYYQQLLEMKK